MKRPVIMLSVICNMVQLCLSLGFMIFWPFCIQLNITAKVTELDRAGVINADSLKEFSVPIAENPRYRLGEYISNGATWPVSMICCLGIGIALINLLITLRLRVSPPAEMQNEHESEKPDSAGRHAG